MSEKDLTEIDESVVDVTDKVEVYEKGKVWEGQCGQDIGANHDVRTIKCATCERINLDREAVDRVQQSRDERQATVQETTTEEGQTSIEEFIG